MFNGITIVAELPFEHLPIYKGYKRLGKLIHLGAVCVICEKDGVHLAAIRRKGEKHIVFALFTEDWIELTIDHIKARARGGKNTIDNYQTMCKACNQIKGAEEISVEELRGKIQLMYSRIVNSTTDNC